MKNLTNNKLIHNKLNYNNKSTCQQVYITKLLMVKWLQVVRICYSLLNIVITTKQYKFKKSRIFWVFVFGDILIMKCKTSSLYKCFEIKIVVPLYLKLIVCYLCVHTRICIKIISMQIW